MANDKKDTKRLPQPVRINPNEDKNPPETPTPDEVRETIKTGGRLYPDEDWD